MNRPIQLFTITSTFERKFRRTFSLSVLYLSWSVFQKEPWWITFIVVKYCTRSDPPEASSAMRCRFVALRSSRSAQSVFG